MFYTCSTAQFRLAIVGMFRRPGGTQGCSAGGLGRGRERKSPFWVTWGRWLWNQSLTVLG